MSWHVVRQTDLTDGVGVLSIITESNGVSWKLFSRYLEQEENSGAVGQSDPWWFTDATRASLHHDGKVEEAEKIGWRKKDAGGADVAVQDQGAGQ